MTTLHSEVAELLERSRRIASADRQRFTFGIAGCRIRITSAGPAMLDLVRPALAHLDQLDDNGPADLAITLWDAESAGEQYPDLPLPAVGPLATGMLMAPEFFMSYSTAERTITVLDRINHEAAFIVNDVPSVPPWERPCPLRTLFSWWFIDRGLLLAHSAAVSTDDGAALLIGAGGSGKSSTAMACLVGGMGYLGDDYVLVDLENNEVWSLYGSAKLVEAHLERNPGLMTTEGAIVHEAKAVKRYGWPAREYPDRVRLHAPIGALVLPVVTRASECRLLPSTAARALLALAPSTMFQSSALKEAAFALSSALVRGSTPYRLELGDGVERVPDMLAELIAAGVRQ